MPVQARTRSESSGPRGHGRRTTGEHGDGHPQLQQLFLRFFVYVCVFLSIFRKRQTPKNDAEWWRLRADISHMRLRLIQGQNAKLFGAGKSFHFVA